MKKMINHIINSRIFTSFNTIERELNLYKKVNYLFDLSYIGILDVAGNNSLDFLQGQLTCDLRLVSDIQMIQGAQCNLKGRILSLSDIINWNGFKLVLPKDLLEATRNSFNKTAQLSRVDIQPTNNLKVFGFYLQNRDDLVPYTAFLPTALYGFSLGTGYCSYHLGDGFYIFIVQSDVEEELCSSFIAHDQFLGSLAWHALRLSKHHIEIYPESRGLFLPHRLGLHKSQYLSFDKGCYKGQEIIARTHYRATIKHELKIYKINSQEAIHSGQRLLKVNEETEAGELIDYSPLGNHTFLIAASIIKDAIEPFIFEGHTHPVVLEPWPG